MILLENVSKEYKNGVHALRDINLSIEDGEFVYIIGPTGSGKSTLIKLLDGEEIPNSGTVMVENINVGKLKHSKVPVYRRNIGVVFQDFRLLPRLTIFENIALALSINGVKEKEIKERVISISKKLQIDSVLQKYPYEISGGQKQRCACARAIVNEPVLILADEPTGALDSISSKKLMELLSYMNSDLNETIIMVTHDPVCASYAKRVIFLKDGSIYQELRDDKKPLQYNAIIQTIERLEER